MTPPKKYHDLCHLSPEFNKANSNEIAKIAQDFEADVVHAERHLANKIAANADALIPKQDQVSLPPSAQASLDRYAVVDTLAIWYRFRSRRSLIALLAVAFFAMLILEFFAHILSDLMPVGHRARWVFFIVPILWFAAWVLWRLAHSNRIHKKHLDYRALAEGLRVQLFWKLLGLQDLVEDTYLPKQKGELEWICCAIACWRDNDQKAIADNLPTPEQLNARKALVSRCWIKGQVAFYKKAGRKEKSKCDGWRRLGAALLWSSVFLSVVLGGCEVWYSIQTPHDTDKALTHLEGFLVFAISMLLTGSAVAVAYTEKMAFVEHCRQYDVTYNLFYDCDLQVTGGSLSPSEVELFRSLGKAALQENGDWLLLHRDRPLEIMVP